MPKKKTTSKNIAKEETKKAVSKKNVKKKTSNKKKVTKRKTSVRKKTSKERKASSKRKKIEKLKKQFTELEESRTKKNEPKSSVGKKEEVLVSKNVPKLSEVFNNEQSTVETEEELTADGPEDRYGVIKIESIPVSENQSNNLEVEEESLASNESIINERYVKSDSPNKDKSNFPIYFIVLCGGIFIVEIIFILILGLT